MACPSPSAPRGLGGGDGGFVLPAQGASDSGGGGDGGDGVDGGSFDVLLTDDAGCLILDDAACPVSVPFQAFKKLGCFDGCAPLATDGKVCGYAAWRCVCDTASGIGWWQCEDAACPVTVTPGTSCATPFLQCDKRFEDPGSICAPDAGWMRCRYANSNPQFEKLHCPSPAPAAGASCCIRDVQDIPTELGPCDYFFAPDGGQCELTRLGCRDTIQPDAGHFEHYRCSQTQFIWLPF